MDAPFSKHIKRHDTRGVPGTGGSLPPVPGISLGSLPGTGGSPLARLEAMTGMAQARLLLMPTPPARPGQDQRRTAGWGEEQAGQQAARFGHRERTQRGGDERVRGWGRHGQPRGSRAVGSQGDAGQKGQGQHEPSVIWRYQPT